MDSHSSPCDFAVVLQGRREKRGEQNQKNTDTVINFEFAKLLKNNK